MSSRYWKEDGKEDKKNYEENGFKIGERFQEFRKELNMSQEDFCAKLQVNGYKMNRQTLSRIENTGQGISEALLYLLTSGKVFKKKMDLNYLFTGQKNDITTLERKEFRDLLEELKDGYFKTKKTLNAILKLYELLTSTTD